jgi:conjugative transfer signal peptidase TraF
MEAVGQRVSVVQQDKGNAVLYRARPDFSATPAPFLHRQITVRTVFYRVARTVSHGAGRKRVRRCLWSLGAIITGAALLSLAGLIFHLRIILTDSAAPAGIYRLAAVPVSRGELVAACLPAALEQQGLARGYLRRGDCSAGAEPVAKVIGALPGDVVEVERGCVVVNGVKFSNSQTAARDSTGRPLGHVAWGGHRVRGREIWLFGFNNPRSWDARYFGPVPAVDVRDVLRPLLTW